MEEKKVMHHWRCQVCGYVYETSEKKLPEDFVCPVCGAPRSEFERID